MAALCCAAASSLACEPGWALRLAPADADVVVVVRGAKVLRGGEAGKAVERALRSLMGGGELEGAWDTLAQRFGWTSGEAFDRLFGECAMVVVRGIDGEEPARWALVSEVGRDTERELRKTISMAPREAMGSAVVLSVERGALELALSKSEDGARVVVGPRGERGLTREMVKRLGKGRGGERGSASATEAVARLGDAAEEASVVAVVRGACGTSWGGLAASVKGARVEAMVAAGAGNVGEVARGRSEEALRVWGGMREGAVLSAVEQPRAVARVWSFLEPTLGALGYCEEGKRFAEQLSGWMGVGVYGRAGGGMSVGCVAGVKELGEGARWGDGFGGNVLSAMGIEGQRFGGIESGAVRVVDLGLSEGLAARGAWPVGERARWTWRERAGGGGWLAAGIGEEGFARALGAVEDGDGGRGVEGELVSLGSARPRELLSVLEAAGVRVGAVSGVLSVIEGMSWELRVDGKGVLSGQVGIRAGGE